jgi:drug/metabolite transporter (DMT)-like permease
MNSYLKGIFLTSLSAILFGLNPLFVYLLQTSDINLIITLYIRFLGSVLVYLIIIRLGNIPFVFIKDFHLLFKLFISSFFFLSTAALLIYSYTKVPSGLTTVLHFSYPIIITIMSIAAKRDTFNIPLAVSILLSVIGVILVTNIGKMEFESIGIISAILSAFTFAIYLFMLNDKKIKSVDNNIFVLYLSFFSLLILIIVSFFIDNPFGNLKKIDFDVISVLGALGYVVASALGVALFSYGARKVGGPITGTIGAFEPLTAVFVGILYFNESSPDYYIVGVGLIIVATIIVSLFSARSRKAREIE